MQQNKPQLTRIVGLDFGMARIGVAISDTMKIIAMPLLTLRVEPKTEGTVAKLLAELEKHQAENKYTVEGIVIGLPLMMSGKTGFLADEVKNFIHHLTQATTIPVVTWDERLTSVQAERSMREGSMTRKKRAQKVDTVAAVIILQNYLDSKKFQL